MRMGNCLGVFWGNRGHGHQCRCVEHLEDGQHFENVIRHELQKVEQMEEGRRLSLEGRRLSLVGRIQCDLRMEQEEEERQLNIRQGELRKAQKNQVQDKERLEGEQRNFLKEKDKLKKEMQKLEVEKKVQKMWMETEKENQRRNHEKMKRKRENLKLKQEMSEKELSMKQQRLDEGKILKLEHDNIVHGLDKREKCLEAKERDVNEREEIVSVCETENALERKSLSSQQTKLYKMKEDVSKQCDENRSLLNLLKTKKVT